MLTFGSLFAGIGGFDLGFERAGMQCRWQVEIDPFCQRVLAKHWPDVGRWDDVRTFPPSPADDWRVDVVCGGFPCQDISACNYQGQGIDGERSGLWFEFEKVIRVLRPRYVVAENVPALTFRGLDRVLAGLAESGFDAEWNCLSCRQFGGPHQRDRIFVVADSTGERCKANAIFGGGAQKTAREEQALRLRDWPGRAQSGSALPDRIRWRPNGSVHRMVDGVPDRLDRYRGLGNAVVPQVAEWIGRRLMQAVTNDVAPGGLLRGGVGS